MVQSIAGANAPVANGMPAKPRRCLSKGQIQQVELSSSIQLEGVNQGYLQILCCAEGYPVYKNYWCTVMKTNIKHGLSPWAKTQTKYMNVCRKQSFRDQSDWNIGLFRLVVKGYGTWYRLNVGTTMQLYLIIAVTATTEKGCETAYAYVFISRILLTQHLTFRIFWYRCIFFTRYFQPICCHRCLWFLHFCWWICAMYVSYINGYHNVCISPVNHSRV